jgi:hypothetical protein
MVLLQPEHRAENQAENRKGGLSRAALDMIISR